MAMENKVNPEMPIVRIVHGSIKYKYEVRIKYIGYDQIPHLSGHGAASLAGVVGHPTRHIVALLLDLWQRDAQGGLEGVRHIQVCPVYQLTELPTGNVVTIGEMR